MNNSNLQNSHYEFTVRESDLESLVIFRTYYEGAARASALSAGKDCYYREHYVKYQGQDEILRKTTIICL